ncbi:MAG TPA: CRTAC1 family protein [Candidatus Limnocylindrales bacterium]|nr:CRTAC1 family protein [Candidatus Limnocylindrales bacterium]
MTRRAARIAYVAGVVLFAAATLGASSLPAAPAAAAALGAPHLVEQATAAGIDHRYDGEFTYFVGGGVAVLDCDGDGRPDLYFAGGAEPAALYRNASPAGGELAFTAVPSPVTDLGAVTGAYPLDVDSDGLVDLAVLRVGENVLLRGIGDCGFERANERWGFDGGDAWSVAFSAMWEEASTLPTLAIGNYLVLDDQNEPTSNYACDDNELHRPGGTGTYGAPIALSPGWCTLSILFSDWDRSGRRDLRVSNDRHYNVGGQEQLWRIETGAAPTLWTQEEGWQPLRIWGMGIASHDLTADGYPEIYLTSQADNKLQTLADGASRPEYEDIAIRLGATAHKPYAGDVTMRSTAWHAEFADANNDGFIDLLVSKGNVEVMNEYAARDPNNLLIGQADGTFVEGGGEAGIATFHRARGAALSDLNLDGLLDLVVVNRRENVQVWRNVGSGDAASPAAMGNWLAVRLEQPGTNRDAVGAWIQVRSGDRVSLRELTVGGGHASGQLGWSHFGLGAADHAEVRVTWPDGEVGPWQQVAANRHAIVERATGELQPWTPAEEDGE